MDDPTTSVSELLAGGLGTDAPITDPKVKAQLIEAAAQAKENIWFEGTDTKDNFDKELSRGLDGVIDVELFGDEEPATRTGLKSKSRTIFLEEYEKELRKLQRGLAKDPERDSKMLTEVLELQKSIVERWKAFKTLEKQFEEGRLKELMEDEDPTFPSLPKLEEAKENIDGVLNSWLEDVFIKTASNLFFTGQIGDALRSATKRQDLKAKLITADVRIDAKDRSVAFAQADFIDSQLQEEYKDNKELSSGLFTLRQFYGYRNPSEIKPDDVENLDFRFTPMYESEQALLTEATQAWQEISIYKKSPESLDIDKFPAYKLYNEKFGINTIQQLEAFVKTQKAVLATKSR